MEPLYFFCFTGQLLLCGEFNCPPSSRGVMLPDSSRKPLGSQVLDFVVQLESLSPSESRDGGCSRTSRCLSLLNLGNRAVANLQKWCLAPGRLKTISFRREDEGRCAWVRGGFH